MRHLNILSMLAVSVIALSACSSDNPKDVGSRDDIVVTNRGMTPNKPIVNAAIAEAVTAEVEPMDKMADKGATTIQNEMAKAEMATPPTTVVSEQQNVDKMPKEKSVLAVKQPMDENVDVVVVPSDVPQKIIKKTTVVKAPAPVTTPQPVVMPAKAAVPAQAKAVAEKMMPAKTVPSGTTVAPATIARATTEDLNCQPNKLPMTTVAGGCYARAVIPNKGTSGMNCMEMRQILCKDNMGALNVKRIQAKLNSKGYNVPIDGVFGQSTINAMDKYQRKNGLPTNALTYESLNHLGATIENAKM